MNAPKPPPTRDQVLGMPRREFRAAVVDMVARLDAATAKRRLDADLGGVKAKYGKPPEPPRAA